MLCIRKKVMPVQAVKFESLEGWQDRLVEIFGKCVLKNIKIDPWILDGQQVIMVNTPFKLRTINDGDYLVKETDGNYYVYSPELFEKTYCIIQEVEE